MKYTLFEEGRDKGGLFETKDTPKGFKIIMIEEPFHMLGASETAFKNKTKTVSFTEGKKTKHAVRKLPNNEYVIYFYQSGIPCYFKKEKRQ